MTTRRDHSRAVRSRGGGEGGRLWVVTQQGVVTTRTVAASIGTSAGVSKVPGVQTVEATSQTHGFIAASGVVHSSEARAEGQDVSILTAELARYASSDGNIHGEWTRRRGRREQRRRGES